MDITCETLGFSGLHKTITSLDGNTWFQACSKIVLNSLNKSELPQHLKLTVTGDSFQNNCVMVIIGTVEMGY